MLLSAAPHPLIPPPLVTERTTVRLLQPAEAPAFHALVRRTQSSLVADFGYGSRPVPLLCIRGDIQRWQLAAAWGVWNFGIFLHRSPAVPVGFVALSPSTAPTSDSANTGCDTPWSEPVTPQAGSLAYWLGEDVRGQGLAREAAARVLDAACEREAAFTRFVIEARPLNLASRRVARSLGMVLESRTGLGRDGLLMYGITRGAWVARSHRGPQIARVS